MKRPQKQRHKTLDKEGRSYKVQKERKEREELDEKYIEDEVKEYEDKHGIS